jgi:RimJ/RimL family protein N-acetyltransferase
VLAAIVLIKQVEPRSDITGLDHCYRIVAECERHDDPGMPVQSRDRFATWVSGFGDPRQVWLATDDAGQAVGCSVLSLPARENLTMAMCLLAVVPTRRRARAGTDILAHCVRQARLAGRMTLAGEAIDGSAGAAFAAAVGAAPGMAQVFRQLAIDANLAARLPDLRTAAEGHAVGYTLLHWAGATPDEYMADSARLSAAMADAPTDAGVEPQIWDADRIRDFEQTLLGSGRQIYTVVARHDSTGRLAGITQITIDPANPGWAQQGITTVLPEHRGRRLGLLTKTEMLDIVLKRAPDVRRIVVRNAGANDHMVAINEQLGYQITSVRRDWELDLTATSPAQQPQPALRATSASPP